MSDLNQHTPWTVQQHREHLHVVADGRQIEHTILEANDPRDQAIASLMAAAPDLLDALTWCAGYIASIPEGPHHDDSDGETCMHCYQIEVKQHMDQAFNKARGWT